LGWWYRRNWLWRFRNDLGLRLSLADVTSSISGYREYRLDRHFNYWLSIWSADDFSIGTSAINR
jgi:hypothetical protein